MHNLRAGVVLSLLIPPLLLGTAAAALGDQQVRGTASVPDAASKADALTLVKQIFAKEYSQKSPAGRQTLATKLIEEAEKPDSKDAARFVLLQEANSAAVTASDVVLARKAVERLGRGFDLDALPIAVEAILKLAEGRSEEKPLVEWGTSVARQQIGRDDFPGARKVMRAIAGKIVRVKDVTVRSDAQAVGGIIAEYDRARPALEKVKSDRTDPVANAAAGRFLCFYREDWKSGLPLLTSSNDSKLSELARMDLAAPADAASQYKLAGEWWELGSDKPHAALTEAAHGRAVYWYAKAVNDLSGLQRALAKRRISDVEYGAIANNNVVSEMVPDGKSNKQQDGSWLLIQGNLKYPKEITVPFRLDTLVKTTSKQCSIRLTLQGSVSGQIILNWEDGPEELRYADPGNGEKGFKEKGAVPIDQFVHITWILTEAETRILRDGEELAVVPATHKAASGTFFFNVWNQPGVVVKSLSIRELPAGKADPGTR